LPYERAAAGPCLDDPEELEGAQSFANRSARHLELLGELSLGRKLIAGAQVALLEETLDLLDDALIEAAPADRLDDGQKPTSQGLVRWSDQIGRQPKPKPKSSSSVCSAELRCLLDAHILQAGPGGVRIGRG
jgi:hypothetical protein